MKVLSVLQCASTYLDLATSFDYYFNENNSTLPSASIQSEYALLLKAFNIVVKEICGEYIAIKHRETVTFDSDKSFDLDDLTFEPSGILKVFQNGAPCKFKILDEKVLTDFVGEGEIEYSIFPEDFDDTDDINIFAGRVSERTLALGVCMEYKFLKNVLDDAQIFEKRFYEGLKGDMRSKKQVVMPAKRWC